MWRLNDVDQANEMRSKLLSMSGNVPSLESIEVGINQSDSPAAFDIVFVGTFQNWAKLREFEADPFHKDVAVWVSNAKEIRHVVDFEI